MGLSAECDVLCEQRAYRCKAHLEERELILRGEFRLTLPFAEIGSLESDDERLILNHAGPAVTLVLGKDARKWAAKITHPASLIDKLGVKEGQVVSVLGIDDPRLWEELRDRTVEDRGRDGLEGFGLDLRGGGIRGRPLEVADPQGVDQEDGVDLGRLEEGPEGVDGDTHPRSSPRCRAGQRQGRSRFRYAQRAQAHDPERSALNLRPTYSDRSASSRVQKMKSVIAGWPPAARTNEAIWPRW